MDAKEVGLRKELYDLGYKISTNEMPREFYFKNRTSEMERSRLINVLRVLKRTTDDLKERPLVYHFGFGIIGIGTSVWPETKFGELAKFFEDNGVKREDYFIEKASGSFTSFGRLNEFKTYQDYLKYCNTSKEDEGKVKPISEKEFKKKLKREQEPYTKKKKVGDFLDRKEEDLDFLICPDYSEIKSDNFEKIEMLYSAFVKEMKKDGYKIKEEEDALVGKTYLINPIGEVVRLKEIDGLAHDHSCRISFPKSRSFHFYFDNQNLILRLRYERIENFPFCQILRKGQVKKLESMLNNSEETGVFENPAYLGYERAY